MKKLLFLIVFILCSSMVFAVCPDVDGSWDLSSSYSLTTSIDCDTITINSGGVVTFMTPGLIIHSKNLTLNSGGKITATGKGCSSSQSPNSNNVCSDSGVGRGYGEGSDGINYYNPAAGAGHGGAGGDGYGNELGGYAYGNATYPVLIGSGGGEGGAGKNNGGIGAGTIRLNISEVLIINGLIEADGGTGAVTHGLTALDRRFSGAGSGGSILIETFSLDGSGIVNAVGGPGGWYCDLHGKMSGGGASGGRVAIYYITTPTFSSSNVNVSGGMGNWCPASGQQSDDGSDGTSYFIKSDYCGDAIQDSGEACDDADPNQYDYCGNTCGDNLPVASEFVIANLTSEDDLRVVADFELATVFSSIKWESAVDVYQQDLDANIEMGPDFVSLDSSNLPASFNSTANVTFTVNGCDNLALYYSSSTYNNLNDIITNGVLVSCIGLDPCSDLQCVDGVVTFTAEHFDSFGGEGEGDGFAVPEFNFLGIIIIVLMTTVSLYIIKRNK